MSTEQTENDVAKLLPLYVLGSLDSEELAAVEEYLAQHPEQSAHVRELEDGIAQLAHAAPTVPLPVGTKGRLMARVQADTAVAFQRPASAQPGPRAAAQPRRRLQSQRSLGWLQVWSAVFALAFVGMLVWNIQLQRMVNTPAAQIAELAGQPTTQISLLVSTPAAPNATGRLYLTPDGKRGVLAVSGLPVPPNGQQYQFWFARPDKSRDSAAVFAVGAQGEALVSITAPGSLAQYNQIWITQEPVGGSAKPTPPHFMEGPLVPQSSATHV